MKLLFLSTFTLLMHPVHAADKKAWKSRSIYFALTDRIARSSDDNGGDSCRDLGNYCGGTFQGLQGKLDYIKGMGFDAIWITPVVANSDGGYHGYWAQDLYSVNANYGTADDLKSLVDAAHEKIDYSNQTSIENCQISGLPDLYTQSATIRTIYQDWIKWLLREYGFDGVRIDTVKHVEHDYWTGFTSAAAVYTVGEVWNGDPVYVARYADSMSGLLNYPVYYPLTNFYQQKGSSQALVDMHDRIGALFPDPCAMATFLDNHDNPRFLSQKNDTALLKNSLTYVLLGRGVPVVYYGTEQGFSGGDDPRNREDLWRSGFDHQGHLYAFISRVLGVRRSAGGLASDDHTHLFVDSTAYAWSRDNGSVMALTSNIGQGGTREYCFGTRKANGSWKGALDGKTYTADGDGMLCARVVDGAPVVFVA
ncbi:hypothetical protein ED733_003265 [Metarhizium rileyi]|uniref:Glycosyl hydrolase family 13 catalytic domain-containing protein n=1 Tax=Metarhizium rileyi (strain RCEF 4871) TaxID=1649241 RepID=A0A5C6GA61_METRR|nr:hypothetical protein ED733_003265 [Metarhizium rileyi]